MSLRFSLENSESVFYMQVDVTNSNLHVHYIVIPVAKDYVQIIDLKSWNDKYENIEYNNTS